MFDISDVFRNSGGLGSPSQLDRQRGEVLDDPAPSWRYSVLWPTLIGFTDQFVLDHIVAETINFNSLSTGPIGRHATAKMTYFPDFSDTQGSNATFYLDQYYRALSYFATWRRMVVDVNGDYVESDFYKFDIPIHVFSYDNSSEPVVTLKLLGVWPTEVNTIELSYENSERVRLDVSFSVDGSSFEVAQRSEDGLSAGSVLQTGQRIIRTGRRGLREITDIGKLF